MRHQVSLTGDTGLDRLVPAAAQVAGAVHNHVDTNGIAAAIETAIEEAGDELAALRGLVLVLAAMVPVDRTPSELLAWLAATSEYHRLLAGGVTPQTAARVAAELAGAAA